MMTKSEVNIKTNPARLNVLGLRLNEMSASLLRENQSDASLSVKCKIDGNKVAQTHFFSLFYAI